MTTVFVHQDRDEIKLRAEQDFLNLFDSYGGRRRGKALQCPFHKDRTPSASIFKGRFHCFVCNISYDPIEFVRQIEQTDFKSALMRLADRYGVPLQHIRLTAAERHLYDRRRRAADKEAYELVDWQESIIWTLRHYRDIYFGAYHRCLRFISRHGLENPQAGVIADACELYERRYQEFDQRVQTVESTPFVVLLRYFRARRKGHKGA